MQVWANNYTRVLQTARMFLHGYMGPNATRLGDVVSVTSKVYPGAIGNSLAPSDQCPKFSDPSGSEQVEIWKKVYVPPIWERVQSMIEGDLVFTEYDITLFPYLCGFESQITGQLSPWCGIFTDDELKSYEYQNDLRYFYGIGVGTDLPKKMMTPYLGSLVKLLQDGPGATGIYADGSTYKIPKLLMSFMNDGQLNELAASTGVFDGHELLDPAVRNDDRLFMASRFSTMRGTIAFERLTCSASCSTKSSSYLRVRLNEVVYPIPSCKSGPGFSCPIDEYVAYVEAKQEAEGDWITNCNVTAAGAPQKAPGATFFKDLTSPWLQILSP
jgi:acid phosphatase